MILSKFLTSNSTQLSKVQLFNLYCLEVQYYRGYRNAVALKETGLVSAVGGGADTAAPADSIWAVPREDPRSFQRKWAW